MLNALLMFLLMYYASSRSRSAHTGKQDPGVEANAGGKQNDQANASCGESLPGRPIYRRANVRRQRKIILDVLRNYFTFSLKSFFIII